MIDLLDGKALKASGIRYIILHKNPKKEMFDPKFILQEDSTYLAVKYLYRVYTKSLGQPFFEDNHLIVFKIMFVPNDC